MSTDRPSPGADGTTAGSTRPAGNFVSAALQPAGLGFARPGTVGEPALPLCFRWKARTFTVQAVVRTWKEREPDRTHGSGQLYTRRHWFELRMDDASLWTVYFQRQPGSRRTAKARWWLYQVHPA